jgi:hypothetical protein
LRGEKNSRPAAENNVFRSGGGMCGCLIPEKQSGKREETAKYAKYANKNHPFSRGSRVSRSKTSIARKVQQRPRRFCSGGRPARRKKSGNPVGA